MSPEELVHKVFHLLLEKHDSGKRSRVSVSEKVFKEYRENKSQGIVYSFNDLVGSYSGKIKLEWKQKGVVLNSIELLDPEKIAKDISYRLLSERLSTAVSALDSDLGDNHVYQKLRSQLISQWQRDNSFHRIKVDDFHLLPAYFKCAEQALSDYQSGIESDYRHFSSRVLRDSKALSAIKPGVANLLKALNPEAESLDPESVLQLYGISPLSHPIFISGAVTLFSKGYSLDLEFPPSVGVWVEDVERVLINDEVKLVTTIENLATFNRYVREERQSHEIVMFTSGVPSPSFLKLLKLIEKSKENIIFRHWGDIDLGGFIILNILDKSIFQPVNGYRMSSNDYLNKDSDVFFSEADIKRLENIGLSNYNKKIMQESLDCKKKFEQEAFY